MEFSDFVFDSIDRMHYKSNKISLNLGRDYVDSLDWMEDKKTTIKPKKGYNCFQYAVKFALNYDNIVDDPGRKF